MEHPPIDHSQLSTLGLTAKWGSVRVEELIACSADDAWARIADAANNASWFTSLTASWLEADPETGRVIRKVTMPTGATMIEDLVLVDHVQRRLQYQLRPVAVIAHHLATIDVIDLSALAGDLGRPCCLVVYSTDLSPRPLALAFAAGTRRALATLKQQLTEVEQER